MPIYEYQCGECQHEFEALQKMSDSALVDCPECNKPTLIKKISATAFRLSGSGWYETDFKSGKKKNLAGETAKSSDGAKSTDGKKENTKEAGKNSSKKEVSGATSKPTSA